MNKHTILHRVRYYNTYTTFFLFILLFSGTVSCDNKRDNFNHSIFNKYTNKVVLFPENLTVSIRGEYALLSDIVNKPYKVLCYIDMRHDNEVTEINNKWEKLFSDIESLAPQKVEFIFWTKCSKEKVGNYNFNFPFFIDEDDLFTTLNGFQANSESSCFLLNENDQIILVGNPVCDNSFWKTYKEIILQYDSIIQSNLTTIDIDSKILNLGTITKKKTAVGSITLFNKGNCPLIIQNITSSCGCTEVEFDKSPILIGTKSTIKIKYKTNVSGNFQKNLLMYCNIKDSPVSLIVKGVSE